MTYEEIVAFVEKNIKKTAVKKIENHTAVEFDIYGEGEGAFYIEIEGGVLTVAPYEYYDHDAKVLITGDELVKIIQNEKSVEESLSEGILMVEGSLAAAQEMLGLVKAPAKKETPKKTTAAKKSVSAEKKIVKATKSPNSKIAKDIKK